MGFYNYTIIATDGYGANVSDQVIVGVFAGDIPPQITHPSDLQFVKGSGAENITWVITDPDVSGPTYIIYQNGTQITSQSWVSNVPIVIQVGTLDVGSYNYTIIATDGLGANVSDQVIVGVIADVPPKLPIPTIFNL